MLFYRFTRVEKAVVLLVAVMLAACSQASGGTAHPSQSLPASPTPLASPTASDQPLTTVGFSCQLPIWTADGQGAFISFPTRSVSFDPKGKGLQANGGVYYDRAFSRWLPVSRQAVSPDGKHYAYGQGAPDKTKVATMHVVDVATGVDHVFATPSTEWFVPYSVLDYAAEGIYLYTNYELSVGLWLMDPTTGAIHRVANLTDIQASGGNRTFWVGSVNPADPNPLGGLGIMPNQIDRFSLADGKRVAWFYRPSTAPRVIGSDVQGHPIVLVFNGRNGVIDGDYGAELILLISPQSQRSIFKGPVSSMFPPISDSHGIWFGSGNGTYLYTGEAFLKVSDQPGFPANGCF